MDRESVAATLAAALLQKLPLPEQRDARDAGTPEEPSAARYAVVL